MTLPRTVAEVLSEHVSFEVECIDRMYLNVYQPRLQHPAGAAAFFVGHRGHPFASSALMDPMSKGFVAGIDRGLRAAQTSRGWSSPRASARTTWRMSTWPGSSSPRECCSSAGHRRRPGCSAPNGAATRSAGRATRGSCVPPGWSTTCTSTASTRTSGRSSSSSARTSPTPPSFASTATSGPNGRQPRPASGSPRWTTGSPPSMTSLRCSRSASS